MVSFQLTRRNFPRTCKLLSTSEDFSRWVPDLFKNREKKETNVCKNSIQRHPIGLKNLLSVQNRSKIQCCNNRLPNQLLLSSEIGPFEDQPSENPPKSTKILMKSSIQTIGISNGNLWFLEHFTEELVFKWLKWYLSRSSRGVGWANGYCHIVFWTYPARWAGLQPDRMPLDLFLQHCFFFFAIIEQTPGYRSPPGEILWHTVTPFQLPVLGPVVFPTRMLVYTLFLLEVSGHTLRLVNLLLFQPQFLPNLPTKAAFCPPPQLPPQRKLTNNPERKRINWAQKSQDWQISSICSLWGSVARLPSSCPLLVFPIRGAERHDNYQGYVNPWRPSALALWRPSALNVCLLSFADLRHYVLGNTNGKLRWKRIIFTRIINSRYNFLKVYSVDFVEIVIDPFWVYKDRFCWVWGFI